MIYLSGAYGDVIRFDRRTSFSQNVTPWPLGGFGLPINKRKYRDPWTPVLVFSPADKTSLYLGTQYVMKTIDGGLHWQQISPDLTGTVSEASDNGRRTVENAEPRGYGVIYTIAPSPLKADQIWAGTDTGRIHLTTDDGKTWRDVTPPGLAPWSKISLIEASHFDPATAYAAVDRHRLDDQKPYLYITHDYGKTWKLSVNGIATTHFLRAVREDTEQKNLLFAGTEFGVYVSFDAGDNVAAAESQPARQFHSRLDGKWQRFDRCHAWPLLLGARRHCAASPGRRSAECPGLFVCTARRRARGQRWLSRIASSAGRAAGRQSSRRRHRRLLPSEPTRQSWSCKSSTRKDTYCAIFQAATKPP